MGAIINLAAASLLSVLCLVISSKVLATADGPDFYRVQGIASDAVLLVHAEPRLDAFVIARLPGNAACLRNLGCQGGLSLEAFSSLSEGERQRQVAANPRWCRINHQGHTGWVEGRFLAEAGCADVGEQDRRVVPLNLSAGRLTIRERIRGREFVDYLLPGLAGQTLSVSLAPSNRQNYFNLNPPGSQWSMFVGSSSGNSVKRLLPVDGVYAVRVYLMRAAGRRGETSRFTMNVSLSGEPLAARPLHIDALIPGTPYHASASIICAEGAGAPRLSCESFVIRRGFDGAATLEIRWPGNGSSGIRRILFVKGLPVSSDSTEPLSHVRQGETTHVRLGDREVFEVPDALIFGG
ncbi:MAG: hypothetical protein KA435_02650 [Azonexus sp.]|nr:hypothetical protein [Azonexus sp.]MBP6201934.1 hypothetical protein [Azonexus sp.]